MRKVIIYSTILFVIFFASCVAPNLFAPVSRWMPPDFDGKNSILMVQVAYTGLVGEEKKMAEYAKEHYPYRMAFVLKSDILSKTGPFADAGLYRFAVMDTSIYLQSNPMKGGSTASDFFLYDRLNNKIYPYTARSSYRKSKTFEIVIDELVKKTKAMK